MPWFEPALAGAGVLFADQLSKQFALAWRSSAGSADQRSFVAIRCIVNRRGTLLPLTLPLRIGAFVLCGACAVLALTQEPLLRNALGAVGIGAALGGIVSNFIDLIRRNGIIDFIAVGSLPIFNLADAAIVGGLVLALWTLM